MNHSMSNFMLRVLFFSLFIALLNACTTPPKKTEHTPNALELARNQLALGQGTSKAQRIIKLPQSETDPVPEINQEGSVPEISSITTPEPGFEIPGPEQEIQLEYRQTDLRMIIEEMADVMGMTIVFDNAIGSEKITMVTPEGKSIKKEDLWPLFQLFLVDSGITMEKKGGIYHLKKAAPGLPGSIGLSTATGSSPEVLQITPLRYITVDSAIAALNPLLQPPLGRMIKLPGLNLIGVIAAPDRLKKVNKLLSLIDTDPFVHRGMRLFRLENSKAADIQTQLDQILQAILGEAPTYKIIPLERINSILVVAPPRSGFREIEMWIKILDEKRDESSEQIFIYHVRNLEAKELASTLSEVFKSEDKEDEVNNKEEEDKGDTFIIDPDTEELKVVDKKESTKPIDGTLAVSAELKVNIVADEKTNSLIVRATARDYQQLLQTIKILDRVPKEVMINVLIAEVSLNEDNKFGIDWTAVFDNIHSTASTAFGFRQGTNPEGAYVSYKTHSLDAVLNMVSSNGDTQVLSRPSILVRNNEEAEINVGTEEPIITRITDSNVNAGSNTYRDVQYRKTGINLKVTPRINEDGVINLEIKQEVSSLGEQRPPENYQAFNSREVSTHVVVNDGNAIVLGGLIQSTKKRSRQGILGLQDIPVIGKTLFSTHTDGLQRVELVLVIIPEIINPLENNRQFIDLFLMRMEAAAGLLQDSLLFSAFTSDPITTDSLPVFEPTQAYPVDDYPDYYDDTLSQ